MSARVMTVRSASTSDSFCGVRVAVVDTVGAGDTFQAAMLTALAERGVLSPKALPDVALAAWEEVLTPLLSRQQPGVADGSVEYF